MNNPDYRAAYQTVLENVVKLEEEMERLQRELQQEEEDRNFWRDEVTKLEEEIERLKASRDHLKGRREHATCTANDLYERVERLEAENKRLREAVKRARAYLWQADEGEGLDEILRQAIRRQAE